MPTGLFDLGRLFRKQYSLETQTGEEIQMEFLTIFYTIFQTTLSGTLEKKWLGEMFLIEKKDHIFKRAFNSSANLGD